MAVTSLAQLTAIVTLILEYPGGLNVLTGRMGPPSPEDLYQLVESCKQPLDDLGVRIGGSGGTSPLAERIITLADTFDGIVSRFGGWAHIIDSTNEWAAINPNSWRMVVQYHRWVKNGRNRSRQDGPQLERIAGMCGTSKETLCRLVKRLPEELAESILRAPIERREAV